MASERQRIEAAIAALEARRAALGDTLVATALAALRAQLAEVDSAAAPEQALRQVTVLFLDVVGSTALAQHLDAEDMHAAIDALLARCTQIVDAHQGKVLQYAGDSLLAAFGADEVREDDAQRAVHAGLALLAQGRRHAERLAQQHGHSGFDVRIGLHTGMVLLGGGVDAAHSIRGSTVHIAARMEQSAPAGGLRISQATYRHVRGMFDVQVQPPLALKGLAEPLVTYLVRGARPRAFRITTRGIEGVVTRMVGRDGELATLQAAFLRVVREAHQVSTLVVAEAGVGKSRLLHEFQTWVQARPQAFRLFQGRAQPQTQHQPYGLLRDVFARHLLIADDDSMAQARAKLERGVAPLFEADAGAELALAQAHLLGHLIGVDFAASPHVKGIQDDARQIRARGWHAAAQVFRRISAQHDAPVVLLLDDLHFADEASLDFLLHLCQTQRDVALLVLGLTRPTLFERRGDWRDAPSLQEQVRLEPLDPGASRLLADELLRKLDPVPEALRDLVTRSAEGNPFYMEELIKMLIDEGAIEVGEERWRADPARLDATRVPQTLTGVLQARLDGLRREERLALQQASVIGPVFWDQALGAIDAAAPQALPALARRELAIAHPQTLLEGMREFAFKHQILHQVVYDTVLKPMRRVCHAQVATWLAGLRSARANDFLGRIAEHFEKAGDADQACEFFTRAAEHAKERCAHEAAFGYVARAFALLETASASAARGDPQRAAQWRWRLLDVRERMHDLRGERDAQSFAIDALRDLGDARDDDAWRGQAALRRAVLALRVGDFRNQEVGARQALAFAVRVGDPELRLRAQRQLASALGYLGDAAAGKALAQEGLAVAQSLGLRALETAFLNTLSVIASVQDDQFERLQLLRQLLPIDRELGNRRDEAINLGNLGGALASLGEPVQAEAPLQEGLRIARAIGDRLTESYVLSMLSDAALCCGDAALALDHARSALAAVNAASDPETHAMVLCMLGAARLALGEHEPARVAFAQARDSSAAIHSGLEYDAAAGLARVALAQGDLAQALQMIEPLLAQLSAHATLEGAGGQRLIELSCHQVLARAGDPRARQVLAHAHAELQAKAAAISNAEMRRSFLTQVAEHREIVAAWQALR